MANDKSQIEKKFHLVCIGGYGRSGSTILDINLAQKFNGISLGEIRYSKLHIDQDARVCSCSKPFNICPFWSQIIESGTISNDSTLQYFSIIGSAKLLFSSDMRTRILDFYDELFKHNPHYSILIDSSKTGPGAFLRPYILLSVLQQRYHVHFLGLYRHPAGVFRSLQKGSNEEMITGKKLVVDGKKYRLNSAFAKVIFSWSYSNLALIVNHLLFLVRGGSSQIHSIEDLSTNSREIVFRGLESAADTKEGSDDRLHMMGGNRLSGNVQQNNSKFTAAKVVEKPKGWSDRLLGLLLSPILALLWLLKK